MARKLDALLPYYGCKRQAAARIVEAIGEHTAYWEPFCGSCAVLLSKPPARVEVVNDLHGAVTNLARVVQHDELSVRLFDSLYRTAFSEALYQDAIAALRSGSPGGWVPLDWAYRYFIASWMGRNGFAGTEGELRTGFCKRYTSNGGDPATRFRHAVERIPSWWERLRGVTILSEDGIELINRVEDKEGTAIYADPPYLSKQAEYVHDFDTAGHFSLALALSRFARTRVVVSYYDHPDLDRLYPPDQWEKVWIDVPKNLTAAAGNQRAPEVLLVSRRTA